MDSAAAAWNKLKAERDSLRTELKQAKRRVVELEKESARFQRVAVLAMEKQQRSLERSIRLKREAKDV